MTPSPIPVRYGEPAALLAAAGRPQGQEGSAKQCLSRRAALMLGLGAVGAAHAGPLAGTPLKVALLGQCVIKHDLCAQNWSGMRPLAQHLSGNDVVFSEMESVVRGPLAGTSTREDPELLHAVMDINRDQRMLVIDKLRECLEELPGRAIGLLGLAFKPNTDDMREAPSIDIARVLVAAGADVRAYDPAAIERSRMLLPEVEYFKNAYEVADGADALVLVTEWNEFRQLDMARIKQLMRRPVVVDGRNIYDPVLMKSLGFTYRGIGRE